jgi:putative ATP-dependent endonuclease of the OLD family
MRLVRLSVENFRTLNNVDLQFPHYYTAICGRNDSGKTNIVRAIRGLMNEYDPFGFADRDEISLKTDFTKWNQSDTDQRYIKIAVTLSANRDADAGLYEFLVNYLSLENSGDNLEFCVETKITAKSELNEVIVRINDNKVDELKAQEVLKKNPIG